MRFIAFSYGNGGMGLGARRDTHSLVDLTASGLPGRLEAFLELGEAGMTAAAEALARARHVLPLAQVRVLPPLSHPGKALAIGLNYRDHAAESNFSAPAYPVVFQRYPSSWVAHDEALVCPRRSVQFDYEAELVAVIGKSGRDIPASAALEHVAGYSIFNEGSVRDYQLRTNQWALGKNFDASGSFGPELVTPDELPPGAKGLRIQCRLNGHTMQDANTADMIFDVATLVSACSEAMTLNPGDMIITGTPAGVGLARSPQVWMKPGDVCEVEIEKIGVLRNNVVAQA